MLISCTCCERNGSICHQRKVAVAIQGTGRKNRPQSATDETMPIETKEEGNCRDVMSFASVAQIKIIYCKESAPYKRQTRVYDAQKFEQNTLSTDYIVS